MDHSWRSAKSKLNCKNDVWCSEDGVNWKEVTADAEWKPRMCFSSVVYDVHILILAGWSQENKNFDDVWYSKNGRNWTELKSGVSWAKHHELSAFVFNDKIWMAGGASEPDYQLNSEVWSLFLPENWFND